MASFLDNNGLTYLWQQHKALLAGKSDSDHTHSVATTSAAGLMSAADKEKLDGISPNETANTYGTAEVI